MRYLLNGAVAYLWLLALTAVALHLLAIRPPARLEAFLGAAELYDAHFPLFGRHAWPTYFHVVFGALLAALIPFQLSTRLRRANVSAHRVSGALFVCSGLVAGMTGAYLSVVMPFGGLPETVLVLAMVVVFVWCLVQTVRAALTGSIRSHRRWVVRAVAITLSIATQRVVFSVLLLPGLWPLRTAFWIAIAIAVPLNLAVAEWYLRGGSRTHLAASGPDENRRSAPA